MSTVRLRVLTHKSTLKVGKFPDDTVQSLINIRKFSYLRWLYCSFEHISFDESVLNEIRQYKRISKPGVDLSAYQKDKDIPELKLTQEQQNIKFIQERAAYKATTYQRLVNYSRAEKSKTHLRKFNIKH